MDKKSTSTDKWMDKWIIDRIEESWAVLENAATLESMSLPAASLPAGARPGDTLVKSGGRWQFDHAETEARLRRINERFNRIRRRS